MARQDAQPHKAARIHDLLDDCLRRRLAGESLPDDAILAAHPDLLPELAEELRKLALIQEADWAAQHGTFNAPDAPPDETTAVAQTPGATVRSGDLVLPRKLGPVRLVREIGRGGMGVVWLGRDELLGRDVAVKLLLNAVAGPDDPGFVRFLDGARTAAGIRHLGLTTLHQADLVNGVPYLVMDYVDGPTLADLIRSTGPLSPTAALHVLRPVCDALGELHDRDLVHRDIKPANILINPDGNVFVTDFGLACGRTPPGAAPGARSMAGTPAYMAPEMFDGAASLRSDVYALGVTAFEMLTGTRPFTGTSEEVREKQLREPLPVERLRERGVGPELIDVLERATHKNAMFRYKSARPFLRAVQDAIRPESSRSSTADLAGLVARSRAGPQRRAEDAPTPRTPGSYFDRIRELAIQKQSHRDWGGEHAAQVPLVDKPVEPEAKPNAPSPGPSSEPAVTVQENPVFERLLRGLPELDLFESDLHRRLALTEILGTRLRERRLWAPRQSRSLTSWLPGLPGVESYFIIFVGFTIVWLLDKNSVIRIPLPIKSAVGSVTFLAAMWIPWRHHKHRMWQTPLRLKLLEQGVPVCLDCGYCLRGLPLESARCPECGRLFDERVRQLLALAGAGSGSLGADSTGLMPKLHETPAMNARGRVRRAMRITSIAISFMAVATFWVVWSYPPLHRWYWIALILGILLLGVILDLIGKRRYRVSPRKAPTKSGPISDNPPSGPALPTAAADGPHEPGDPPSPLPTATAPPPAPAATTPARPTPPPPDRP